MPANVTVDYARAEEKYQNAKTPYEKLAALEEMKSLAPSHKGAENLRAGINRKIAQIRNEMEKEKKQASKRGGGGASGAVKKEGIGQIALVGLPSSGKTTFFNQTTGLHMTVGAFGFTTRKPEVGMVDFRGAKIQLVDLPPIVEGSAEGKANGREILSVIRNADALVFVLNAPDAEKEYALLQNELRDVGVLLNRQKPNVHITPSQFPGISITGKQFLKVPQDQLIQYFKSLGMYNIQVILRENTTLETIAEALNEKLVYKKTLIIYSKGKPKKHVENETVKQIAWENTPTQKKEIANQLFEILEKVYVYTKKPGEAAAMHVPLVLPKGSTTLHVAEIVHKDIAPNLKYAKIWGSTKFDGQRVAKDYKVQNGDIVEFYW